MKIRPKFLAFLLIFWLLSGCGGGEEVELPRDAAGVEVAFHVAPDLFLEEGGANLVGIMRTRDDAARFDHLVVHFASQPSFTTQAWLAYANRGTMSDGTDVVLVNRYHGPEDSGEAVLFVDGKEVTLPPVYVTQGGKKLATLRNAREYEGGWLILFASFSPWESAEPPVTHAWLMYNPATGQTINYGEYCARCRRL